MISQEAHVYCMDSSQRNTWHCMQLNLNIQFKTALWPWCTRCGILCLSNESLFKLKFEPSLLANALLYALYV